MNPILHRATRTLCGPAPVVTEGTMRTEFRTRADGALYLHQTFIPDLLSDTTPNIENTPMTAKNPDSRPANTDTDAAPTGETGCVNILNLLDVDTSDAVALPSPGSVE